MLERLGHQTASTVFRQARCLEKGDFKIFDTFPYA